MTEITRGSIGNPPRYRTVVWVCLYTLFIYIHEEESNENLKIFKVFM